MSMVSRRAEPIPASASARARYGTRNCHRISPRNCTTAAITPVVAATAARLELAPMSADASRMAKGANKAAVSAKIHQRSRSRAPPARKRASTSEVGAQDVRIVEASAEQKEAKVECDGRDYEENAGSAFHIPRAGRVFVVP